MLLALVDEPAPTRVPLYELLVMAMERQGHDAQSIATILAAQDDPAVRQLTDALLDGSRLGQPLPTEQISQLTVEGDGTTIISEPAPLRDVLPLGPAVIVAAASWHEPSLALVRAIPQDLRQHMQVIVLSFDDRTLAPDLSELIAISDGVYGDLRGWDSPLDDALGIESLPSWLLYDEAMVLRGFGRVVDEAIAAPLRWQSLRLLLRLSDPNENVPAVPAIGPAQEAQAQQTQKAQQAESSDEQDIP